MRRALPLIAAAVLLTACSAGTPGSAEPAPAPTAAEPTGLVLPPRPRELPLDDVDPCALLTPTQRETLGLTDDSSRSRSTAPGFVGPACSIRGYQPRAVAINIALVTGSGIGVLTGPGATTDDITPITVAGFPALLARPASADFCSVDIDTAEGQFIDVQFADGGRTPPIAQDELCRGAIEVAEQAVTTLGIG
ncbi:DUF3558 domain-containing protein [Pseudonocardia nigra]|uniref:DUF3558 domain-containing protein n=1 Tax=Pseudonocardia nigra TaxID=1921578 RepID=UPI001C5D0BA4|nr:DUF3558 domain-containing protein [Pseudonocardia nigra]